MRKIKLFVMTALLALFSFNLHAEEVKAFDQCSGTVKVYTSEMKKQKIKESKLTSLRYIKKICKITIAFETEDCSVYKLDGGNGVLYIRGDNKFKQCVLVKDGKLYGRVFRESDKGRIVTYNLHDNECSIKGVKATEEQILYLTLLSFEELTSFAYKYILNVKLPTNYQNRR